MRNIRIAELNLYLYDSLADDIEALYADDLYTTLRADVTEKTLEELQNRLDTPDEVSQEYHPNPGAAAERAGYGKGNLPGGSASGSGEGTYFHHSQCGWPSEWSGRIK